MLLLASASDVFRIAISVAADLDYFASWIDLASGAVAGGVTKGNVTSTTTTNVVSAPAASTTRNVKTLSIRNKHASASTRITLQYFDGTTAREIISALLLPGWGLYYDDQTGFSIRNADGALVVTPNDTDAIKAGLQTPRAFVKAGVTMAAAGALRAYTPWYVAGNPGAATASSAGINGEAVTGNSVAGQLPRSNPAGGQNAYLGRFSAACSQIGTMWLVDRLWQNSGLSVTSTTAQAITPATVPSRDINGTNNGEGIYAGIEWSAAGGAGTPLVTLTYTDESGNTGASATFTGVASPPLGTVEIFQLAAGDRGVRVPTSFIQNATRTSGTMHLILFRVLAQLEINQANAAFALDWAKEKVRLYDNTVPQLMFFNSATTAANFVGTYSETNY